MLTLVYECCSSFMAKGGKRELGQTVWPLLLIT